MGKEHMSSQFDAELSEIRLRLLEMGGKVELMIADSLWLADESLFYGYL